MKANLLSIIKYLFSYFLVIVVFLIYKNYLVLFSSIIELLLIFLVTDFLIENCKKVGIIFNIVALLLFNVNMMFMFFSMSYLSTIMLTNVDSISALSSKLFTYIPSFGIAIIVSFLPVKCIKINYFKIFFAFILIIYVYLFVFVKSPSSPIIGFKYLAGDYIHDFNTRKRIKSLDLDKNEFFNISISDNISYDKFLGEKPNIILIFTEGLSSNIIYDNRNIMPHVKMYMENSLSFSNYFNHTSATYRGLVGQLYSSYQYDHYDENKLISIQSILKNDGYYTEFINVEPTNKPFVKYLKSFKFDSLMSSSYDDVNYDKEAYEFLFDEAIRLNSSKNPYFLSIYTYQTHVGCDSSDYKYGNGRNNVLNRFSNNDYQFNEFMEKFNNSELYDNTIIIFTSDHASFEDIDFHKTFKKYKRDFNFLDEIPLFIYHKGVTPRVIDVSGRNSLDLAPTILDYVDISAPNYFLGVSLFSNEGSKYNFDYYYTYPGAYYSTFDGKIEKVENSEVLIDNLSRYYAVCKKQ